jgi:hypothetical protein
MSQRHPGLVQEAHQALAIRLAVTSAGWWPALPGDLDNSEAMRSRRRALPCIVDGTLPSARDAAHGEDVGFVPELDRPTVLVLVYLDDQPPRLPGGVEGQQSLSTRAWTRIPGSPNESFLSGSGFAEYLLEKPDDVVSDAPHTDRVWRHNSQVGLSLCAKGRCLERHSEAPAVDETQVPWPRLR